MRYRAAPPPERIANLHEIGLKNLVYYCTEMRV